MRTRHGRRIAIVSAASAGLLGLTMGASAIAVAAPAPSPSPTQSGSAEPAAPPIALMPPGSLTTGPLVGAKADDGAKIIAYKWYDTRTVDITISSPAVGTNVVTRVLVPKGWKQTGSPTWPLALFLHGGGDDYTSWTRETTIEEISSKWNVVLAMPDAGRSATYTNYFNGGKLGPPAWETFHTVELIQILERAFGTTNQRVIAGLSSGGFGSASYATRNPKLWKFMASYSGALSIRSSPSREALLAADAGLGGDAFARFGVPYVDEANWKEHDPYTNAAKLRGMGVFISSGYTGLPATEDTVDWTPVQAVEILAGNVALMFDIKLSLLMIKHTTVLYPFGEHAWASWQKMLEQSWPMMMKAEGAQQVN